MNNLVLEKLFDDESLSLEMNGKTIPFDYFSYPIILVAFAILCLIDGAYKIVLRNCNHMKKKNLHLIKQ